MIDCVNVELFIMNGMIVSEVKIVGLLVLVVNFIVGGIVVFVIGIW